MFILWLPVLLCASEALAMPQEAVPKQAPTYAPTVTGGYDYQVQPAESSRVTNFLTSYNVPKKFNRVVVIPDDKWDNAVKDFNLPAGTARAAFALPGASTAYVNQKLLKPKSPDQGVEWALAHELEHYNDWRNPVEQESVDRQIDTRARERLKQWKNNQPTTKGAGQ